MPPSLLTSVAIEGISKTTTSFDNSLGGLQELTESCYTHD